MAPFTLPDLLRSDWNYKFSREKAGYPAPWLHELGKVFPYVGRINNVHGDRNLICVCPPVSDYFKNEEGIDNDKWNIYKFAYYNL